MNWEEALRLDMRDKGETFRRVDRTYWLTSVQEQEQIVKDILELRAMQAPQHLIDKLRLIEQEIGGPNEFATLSWTYKIVS